MSGPFKHFIITRFNLKQNIWPIDKMGFDVNNSDWLKDRFDLFRTYCLPSLKLQSSMEFIWLVYFDENTPEHFKTDNKKLSLDFSNFHPKYVSDFRAFEDSLTRDISFYLNETITHVITTRLDNDDALHRDAVAQIQKYYQPKKRAIIDMKNGLTLQIGETNKLAVSENNTAGPFVSLIEERISGKELGTVYEREHLNWIDDVPFIDIKDGYLWMQIIHDRNLSNALEGNLTASKSYLSGFEFLKSIKFSLRYRIFIILRRYKLMGFVKRLKSIFSK